MGRSPSPQLANDVAIIGAGPVGLAIAIELARAELSVLVVDRRPHLDEDAQLRPQLLVARAGDLANLAHLGLDVTDPWLDSLRGFGQPTQVAASRMIAGLFAVGTDRARWVRVELPVAGFARLARCTLLQTPAEANAGTALLVDPQVANPTPEQMTHCFDAAARVHDLAGAASLVAPQIFSTALAAMPRRFVGLDGRAPIVIAGDAAQTGHVFSGQTCFVNLALGLGLAAELRRAKRALVDRKVNDPALGRALARYDAQSEIGASILAHSSARHYAAHQPGRWALAGVARA